MIDDLSKTNQELLEEITALQQKIKELEQSETQQKQDEALRESEELFRGIAMNLPVVVYRFYTRKNGEMGFSFVSDRVLEVLGIDTMPEDLFAFFTKGIPLEDQKRFHDSVRQAVQDATPWAYEGYFVQPSGKRIFFRALSQPKLQEDSVVFHGVLLDITDRRQAEEELLREKQFSETLIDSLSGIFFLYDESLHLKRWNRAHELITGFSADELRDWYIPDWHATPEDAAQGVAYCHSVIESGVGGAFETTLVNKERRFVPYLITTTRLMTPDGPMMMGVGIDITDRRQAEEQLRMMNVFLDSIVENIPDMIFLKEAGELRFARFNRAGEDLLGYSRNDLLGKNDYDFFSEKQADFFTERDRDVLNGNRVVDIPEETIQTRNKGERILHTKKVPIMDTKGDPAYLLGISEDITEQKRAEEALRKSEERLQRAEKMEALGTLAGGVAHDLNNVLGVVVGYAELLLKAVDGSSPLRPRLVNIMKGGERAAAIVQDLLTLARRGVPTSQILNLNDMIIECQQSPEFANLSSYHTSMQIDLDLDQELLNIAGSPVHLSKTLFNLDSNACEAMPNSGTITFRTSNQYLDKPIHGYDEIHEGDYVVLSVSDTGEGIPAADLKRIFEPFYTKKAMGRSGTGLGLAVVWGTVKDHQGYINVQSEEGKGSIFTLYFPVTRGIVPKDKIAVAISKYMGKGETILVVDDVDGQRDLATEMLKELNYNVTSVDSGEEAMTYMQEHEVDLMVLDMIMDPGMDGLDTYRSVLKIRPQQKAIIVSGFSETYRVNAAQYLGAGTYVRKPYVIEKLGLAVRKELDRII